MLQHRRGDTQSEKNCHNSLAVLNIKAIALHLPLIMAVITKKENVHNKCNNTLVQNTLNTVSSKIFYSGQYLFVSMSGNFLVGPFSNCYPCMLFITVLFSNHLHL